MEITSSEQMLDAYSSVGMPLMYRHWSFGKHFLYQELLYRKGGRGLAYELVINSNPCIVYLMEENTMALQAPDRGDRGHLKPAPLHPPPWRTGRQSPRRTAQALIQPVWSPSLRPSGTVQWTVRFTAEMCGLM